MFHFVCLLVVYYYSVSAQTNNLNFPEYLNSEDRINKPIHRNERNVAEEQELLTAQDNNPEPYIITESRLEHIRSDLMYWYGDEGSHDDWQDSIQTENLQALKNLDFELPFFGFRFNQTRVSINGYLEFSDPPPRYTSYPLVFPVKDWPKQNDPSFIGIFFSRCRVGTMRPDDSDRSKEGVYFRVERNVHLRTDRSGVEFRERAKWDVRDGIIGAETFEPKHVIVTTWKNVSPAGGVSESESLPKTNTFQLVVVTDEVFTYAIFNYLDLQWTTPVEALGYYEEGGVPAFVGFNAGFGTRSWSYEPYSQSRLISNLTLSGWANGFKGRHIFRIDENIIPGNCDNTIDYSSRPLYFAPESGNMLGGTVINITGPCFEPTDKVVCKFNTEEVDGIVVSKNRAICVQPQLYLEGYINFEITVVPNKRKFKGKYLVENPSSAAEKVFIDNSVNEKHPKEIKISWGYHNLTINKHAQVGISVWGFREMTVTGPEFFYIDHLVYGVPNNGTFTIYPKDYKDRDNSNATDLKFGFLHVSLTEPLRQKDAEFELSPVLWSRPIPLSWYFAPQWEKLYGAQWAQRMYTDWIKYDRSLKNLTEKLPKCPCTLEQVSTDKGLYLPDLECDLNSNLACLYNRAAIHCVKTITPKFGGAEQQCCYDRNGYLMLSHDQQGGSSPRRSGSFVDGSWNETKNTPSVSQWFHDILPKYICCFWQEAQASGCETLRFERRPTQHCPGYQSPAIAGVYGNSHIITFDGLAYTLNGEGQFVLVRTTKKEIRLDVQARFNKIHMNDEEAKVAQMTSVVARGKSATVVEIRLRQKKAQWRYRLDVFANGRRIYFDRPPFKIQRFPGVTVYTPSYILNQSEVIVMFDSGAGLEVVENNGFMTAKVYLPWDYIHQTTGLFGRFSFTPLDDLITPDGEQIEAPTGYNDYERIYDEFGLKWMVEDREDLQKGVALFLLEYGRTSSFYNNKTFRPQFNMPIQEIIPQNSSLGVSKAYAQCGDVIECLHDYFITSNEDLAKSTLYAKSSVVNLKKISAKHVVACDVLKTPKSGYKSNFLFVPGARVLFDCAPNFQLFGDRKRECLPTGKWNVPLNDTECLLLDTVQLNEGNNESL